MRVLMAGGVGAAAVPVAKERDFLDTWVVADVDPDRAARGRGR